MQFINSLPGRTRLTAAVLVLIAAIMVIVGSVTVYQNNLPVPPTPTPTLVPTNTPVPLPTNTPLPSPIPAIPVLVDGGDIFVKASAQYVREQINVELSFKKIDTFEIKNDPGLGTEVKCIWPGTESALNDFKEAHPTMILASEKVFSTFNVLVTRNDVQFQWYLAAGLAHVEPSGKVIYDKMYETLDAALNDKTWAEFLREQGLEIDEATIRENDWMKLQVNIATSAPEKSSGGQDGYFLFADYLAAGSNDVNHVVTIEEMGPIMPKLEKLWREQSLQDTSSPNFFKKYVSESYSTPLALSSESLYLGWYNGLSEDKKASDGERIIIMYPPITSKTDHIIAAVHSDCIPVVKLFRDSDYLHQLGWDLYGMRTTAGGLNDRPGKTNLETIAINVLSIGSPKSDVFKLVSSVIKPPEPEK